MAYLDDIAERVKTAFLNEIMELSNGEVEVVLDILLPYFEGAQETVRSAVRGEEQVRNVHR